MGGDIAIRVKRICPTTFKCVMDNVMDLPRPTSAASFIISLRCSAHTEEPAAAGFFAITSRFTTMRPKGSTNPLQARHAICKA